MNLITETLTNHLTEILAVTVAIVGGLYLWLQHHYSYWKRQNVAYIEPHPIFGNFKDLIMWKKDPVTYFQDLYEHEKAIDQPIVGLYVMNKPCVLVRDLDLVKSVLIKDFNKFSNRYSSSDSHSDSLGSDNLFFAKNHIWKEIRVKLTPVFTSGRMKQMFHLMEEIGVELDKYLCALPVDPKTKSTMKEVKDIAALYTTDVIATTAYGIRANSLRNPNGDFRTNGKRVFHFTRMRAFEFSAMFFMPSLVSLLRLKFFSKESTKFIRNTLNYVMDEREKSGKQRNDLIDVLLKFRREAQTVTDKKHFILVGDRLIAQAAIFFTAGFETASTTMAFSLYELAAQQEYQTRLREEIREALQDSDGKITYELILEMKFLNQVVTEVLRMYPPLPFLDRECTLKKDEQSYSLKPKSDFAIPHGMPVYVPISAIQRDAKYFPQPHTFNPDRWAPENKHMINMAAYMPFGTGPHNCIGERFGLLQTKIGLVNFLRNHYVTPCEKSHRTMKLDRRALIIQSEGGVYCNIVRDPLL